MRLKPVGVKFVDAGTQGRVQLPGLAFLKMPEDEDRIGDLVNMLFFKRIKCLPPGATSSSWRVFANWKTYNNGTGIPLYLSKRVGGLGASDEDLIIVEAPTEHIVSMMIKSRQVEHLLGSLEWKGPGRLCRSSGKNWPYQGASEIAKRLKPDLVRNYKAWRENNRDRHCRTLNVILSGAGTGKSRMLDEMKGLLVEAAKLSEDEALEERVKRAYVFRVSFDDVPAGDNKLIDAKCVELDISYRMLYQLYKGDEAWPSFVEKLKAAYSKLVFVIEEVLVLLAKLEKIDKLQDMTVLLCVDGLDKLHHDRTKLSKYYSVLTALVSVLNSSRAFVVCACASRLAGPFHNAQWSLRQRCAYLVPPTLNGDEIRPPKK